MAKVAVLEANQDISAAPARYVKRSVADLLVRRLLAKTISNKLIQMVSIREAIEIVTPAPKIQEYDPADGGSINDIRTPDWFFTAYPIKENRTCTPS